VDLKDGRYGPLGRQLAIRMGAGLSGLVARFAIGIAREAAIREGLGARTGLAMPTDEGQSGRTTDIVGKAP